MPRKPNEPNPFASLIDGPTLTMPTLNPLNLNKGLSVEAGIRTELDRLISEREALSAARATPTALREIEYTELRQHISEHLKVPLAEIPPPRPSRRLNNPGDTLWMSLDSPHGEIWSGTHGLYFHRAPRNGSPSFIRLRGTDACVGFACEGAPGTYLLTARIESRCRNVDVFLYENADFLTGQQLQVAGDKVMVAAEFPRGGHLCLFLRGDGRHPIKIFGVEAYRIR
ncbi:MAG: hypothetical protein KC420_15875 [Myxococcales bacterium]|nr:hypothetical protein [Myxococcales bacterium]MCB9704771.1 hypothetical protein [Myxococcales bacterium]